MNRYASLLPAVAALLLAAAPTFASGATVPGSESTPADQQLPKKMHAPMKDRPRVTVGRANADMTGEDNRALQAAVDYVASLGGGTVEIGPGDYLMRDSLHLRSFVTVKGVKGQTILRKADGVSSPLAIDGDYGEEQFTVKNATGFAVGSGVAIWDKHANGFHLTVARVTGGNGTTFSIDHPLNADCTVGDNAMAATIFPVISGCDIEGARIEGLIVDGNKQNNVYLDGCRGGGIYLYRGFGTVIEDCVARNFNGDGISFQQSNDVIVQRCVSEDNAYLGLHPGSGSQRPIVLECVARHNGADGLYLCWRVRYGVFENNRLEENGRFGISIGHKDTDNLLRNNLVRANHEEGISFRDETFGMAGHRNRLEDNRIENNGGAGIRIRGETHDVILKHNVIQNTAGDSAGKQIVGIRFDQKVGPVTLDNNQIIAKTEIDDERAQK